MGAQSAKHRMGRTCTMPIPCSSQSPAKRAAMTPKIKATLRMIIAISLRLSRHRFQEHDVGDNEHHPRRYHTAEVPFCTDYPRDELICNSHQGTPFCKDGGGGSPGWISRESHRACLIQTLPGDGCAGRKIRRQRRRQQSDFTGRSGGFVLTLHISQNVPSRATL